MNKDHLEELKQFIRQHRNSEGNFTKLVQKLDAEITDKANDEEYLRALQEIKSKQAEEYSTAKQKGGSAWPEFEKFVSAFEKALPNS